MKNSLRRLFGVSALALLLTASPVFAAEIETNGENTQTGADSDNENEFDIEMDGDTDLVNTGVATNTLSGAGNTGGNDQTRNTTGGDLDSGSIDASTEWENVLNGGASLMGASDGLEIDADFVNDTTGADSNNDNELDVDNDGDLTLTNVAQAFNVLGLTANTGDNTQSRNTTAGDIDTGDVDVMSAIMNEANNDSGFAGAVASSLSVDVSGENNTTGADSDNENNFDIDNDGEMTINNTAVFTNTTSVVANTGNNTQSRNTTGGSIKTGSVAVESEVENSANNGGSAAGAAGNSLDVKADFVNDTTGADSNNDNELDIDNDGDVTVTNTAVVSNTTAAAGNTGDNTQDRNTTGGDIETGDVSFTSNVVNEVNNN